MFLQIRVKLFTSGVATNIRARPNSAYCFDLEGIGEILMSFRHCDFHLRFATGRNQLDRSSHHAVLDSVLDLKTQALTQVLHASVGDEDI